MKKIIGIIFILSALLLCSCAKAPAQGQSDPEKAESTILPEESISEEAPPEISGFQPQEGWAIVSGEGLEILSAGHYTGSFYEDGSNDAVEGVSGLIVKNSGESLIEYGEIDGGENHFVFTGLPAGATMLVLEANRGTADIPADPIISASVPAVDIHEDLNSFLEVYLGDGVINIRNISGRDFTGDVSLYYKNIQDGILMGGITYRARFSGVPNGELAQSIQSHATSQNTAVLYLSYED